MFMKTIIDSKPWIEDPSLLPLPWRGELFEGLAGRGGKLKVGVLWNDGIVTPHPPVTRAMHEVVSRLKNSEDVEVVEWKPYKHDLAWEFCVSHSARTAPSAVSSSKRYAGKLLFF